MDLQAIEARLAAATPGPWEAQDFVAAPTEDAGSAVIKQGNGGLVAYALRSGAVEHEWYDKPQCDADAEFIAHAPEDIRALIDVVKAVRELHRKVPLYDTPADECTEHDQDVYSIELDSGEWYCSEHIAEWVCSECFNDGGEYVDYPCSTARALGVTE